MALSTDGTIPAAPTAPEQPASPEPAAEEPVNLEAPQPDEEEEASSELTEEELEEIEYGEGKKYRIPKDMKPLLLMQQDYTRKTQSVAEERKALEASRAEIVKQAETQRTFLKEYGQFANVLDAIEQYKKVDWTRWSQQDPEAHDAGWREYQQLKDRAQDGAVKLQNMEQERLSKAQQETATRLEEGQRALAKDIKGWGPETQRQLGDYAMSLGFSAEEAGSITDPRMVKVLHRAWLGDQLAKASKTTQQAPAAQPLTQVTNRGGNPASRKSPQDMDMKEYAQYWTARQKR